MPGTDGAAFPFWSPDGRFIAFFAAGRLKKVDVALGTPQTLAEVAAGRGGSWSPAGVIVFGQSTSPLSQVPADGGPVTAATSFDPPQEPVWHYWPQFLPDGRRFLFLQRSVKPEHQGLYVGSLDSPLITRVVTANVRGLFASGHLLFMRDGLLFAQALDLQTLADDRRAGANCRRRGFLRGGVRLRGHRRVRQRRHRIRARPCGRRR